MSEEKQEAIIHGWKLPSLFLSLSQVSLEGKYLIKNIKYSLNSHLYPSTILQEAKHLSQLSHAPPLMVE